MDQGPVRFGVRRGGARLRVRGQRVDADRIPVPNRNLVGTAAFVAPLYISEVSPPKVRGGLVSFNQLAVTTGILTAYIVDSLFKGVSENWRWMLGLAVIPGAALAVGMLTVPQTPRWLADHGRDEQARDVLQRLRDEDPDADIDQELRDIDEAGSKDKASGVTDLVSPVSGRC